MSTSKTKNILVIIRQAPYSSTLPAAALEVILTAAAFEQELTLLFYGQGVLHLLADQQTDKSTIKNISRALPSLELYEVRRIIADAKALRNNGLQSEELLLPVEPYSPQQIARLIAESDQVFNY
jgi:tRNA 2-thiouridine synthesizing protein C